MRLEDKVKQHDGLMGELIQMHQDSSKRLRIMENIQSFAIPVFLVMRPKMVGVLHSKIV